MTAPTPTALWDVGHQLAATGWRPIPLDAATKVPSEAGWQRRNAEPWDPAELDFVLSYYAENACGLAVTKNLFVVDIDYVDVETVERITHEMTDVLGITPLQRVGNPPKILHVFRSDGTTYSGRAGRLDLFSGTGQFAAFGIHAKTGKPYDWITGTSPLDLSADDARIPEVNQSQQVAFMAALAPIIGESRRSAHTPQRTLGTALGRSDFTHQLTTMRRSGMAFMQAAKILIRQCPAPGQRHELIRTVISVGFNLGHSSAELLGLIRLHAHRDLLATVQQDRYLERLLADFAPSEPSRWRHSR
jgi:hypothetical protein